jgi:carbonic anhydrase
MENYKKLLLANRAWVEDRVQVNPEFFRTMAKDQSPEFLWIGCSDSRVPAEEITGTEPGELFVHRNIANLVVHTDFNLLSVLQYAVDALKVKHIILCGHYGCGGVKNAVTHHNFGLLNKWLRQIKDLYRIHKQELESIPDPDKRLDRLVELNVIESCYNLAKTSIVQNAWDKRGGPTVHGWVYDMKTGLLSEHAMLKPGHQLDDVYMFDRSSLDDAVI